MCRSRSVLLWPSRAAALVLAVVLAAACASEGTNSPGRETDYRLLNDQSASLISARRFPEALAAAEQAIRANPGYSFAWNNKSIALLGLGRTEEALQAADKAIELKPDNALAWSNKSVVLRVQGKLEEAISAAEQALKLDPRNAIVWYNKAGYFALLGYREAALGSLSTALELDPSLKSVAAGEPDLKTLRDLPDFRKLVQ